MIVRKIKRVGVSSFCYLHDVHHYYSNKMLHEFKNLLKFDYNKYLDYTSCLIIEINSKPHYHLTLLCD